jgi:hypothetical protein
VGEGRHEPGQHRQGKFKIPHPTAQPSGVVYKPKKKGLIRRILGGGK